MNRISNNYDRLAAVRYAHRYALAPNPSYKYFSLANTGGDCTNFTSQCLFAGGIPMSRTWWYRTRNPKNHGWSISWTVAGSLFWHLKNNAARQSNQAKGHELLSAHSLELGDLVFYENRNKKIFHSAIVTNFDGSKPLISQHSYEAMDISYEKPWLDCTMHFIRIEY